jgi:hypothetical protein
MRDMMAQIRDVGDGIRDGTYTMTAAKITGGTITGVAFTGNTFTSPVISGGSINNTPIGASTANTGAFTTLSASGVATFSAGTVSAPAITTSGDTNTGIFFPAADTIAFTEGGVEAMRIDSSGRLGIGVTSPDGLITLPAAASNTPKIRLQSSTSDVDVTISSYADASGTYAAFGSNFYLDSAGDEAVFDATKRSAFVRVDGRVTGAVSFGTATTGIATERMRIDSSGNVGIGTSSPGDRIHAAASVAAGLSLQATGTGGSTWRFLSTDNAASIGGGYLGFNNGSYRMVITSGGELLVGKTALDFGTAGFRVDSDGGCLITRNGSAALSINRLTNDGDLVEFFQATTKEGSISVSGTTVSYNGGHLSRWSQLPNNQKDNTLLKGTVMSNLDDMCVWTKDGEQLPNEQLNKMKVSDIDGDTNVAGVFVSWTFDEQCQSDDMNVAMTGDMIIRIAQNVVVQKGDLLMSAGDGTAKPQGDDIVRSKTIAKVTSNHVTCTYADGSYCVPCVLMAC